MSVRATRFTPVPMLETVTWASVTTARVRSVMAPKTVASWVCGHADAEYKTNERATSMHGLCESCLGEALKLSGLAATALSISPQKDTVCRSNGRPQLLRVRSTRHQNFDRRRL